MLDHQDTPKIMKKNVITDSVITFFLVAIIIVFIFITASEYNELKNRCNIQLTQNIIRIDDTNAVINIKKLEEIEKNAKESKNYIFATVVRSKMFSIFFMLLTLLVWKTGVRKSKQLARNEKEIIDLQNLRQEESKIMIQGMSHELRTPIFGIMSIVRVHIKNYEKKIRKDLVENERDMCKKCKGRKFLYQALDSMQLIDELAHRMSDIISNLSDYGKKLRQQNPIPVDMNDIVRSGVKFAKFADVAKKIPVDSIELKEYSPDEKIIVLIIPVSAVQIVQNLVSNAIQAVHSKFKNLEDREEKPRIIIKSYVRGGKFFISVKDNGIGMNKEELSRCTEKYFTTRKDNGGTGLGLHFIKTYTEEAGGKLSIESVPDFGSVFTVSFPICINLEEEYKQGFHIKKRKVRFRVIRRLKIFFNSKEYDAETIDISESGLLIKVSDPFGLRALEKDTKVILKIDDVEQRATVVKVDKNKAEAALKFYKQSRELLEKVLC
jgi:signal transduction histidine kinase